MLQRGSPDQTLRHALGAPACLLYVFSLFGLLCSVFEELQAESPDCRVQEFHIKICISGFSPRAGGL